MNIALFVTGIVIAIFFLGIKIVRPTHRGLIERFGKYNRFASPGFNWIVPAIEKIYQVNITEQMVDAEPQEIITNDNLNAKVDAQVYFKVKPDEQDVKSAIYNVYSYQYQIVNLAYGKRNTKWRTMSIGIVLMAYPYFFSGTLAVYLIGVALTAALYFWRD